MGAGGSPTPPVTGIPYIRNTDSTAYIDTGITPDNTTRVVVWARNLNPGGDNFTFLFGSRVANQDSMFAVAALNGENTGKVRIAYAVTNTDLPDMWGNLSWYHKYELNGKDLYVDDVLVGSGTSGTFTSNLNIYLFGLNNGGVFAGCNLPIDICAVKIYKNNTLVRDLTPVNSPSVGFYDSVSGNTFTNAGTGTLSYGTFDMSPYTPLDYVECGGAYFDSGVYGGYTQPIVVRFRSSQVNGGCVLGYRGSNNWMEFDLNSYSSNGAILYYRLASDSTWRYLYRVTTSSNLVGNDLVILKGTTRTATVNKNYSQVGQSVSPTASSDFVTSDTLNVASLKLDDHDGEMFQGRLYYVGMGALRSYCPAKYGLLVGMYDTYNDVFKPSESETPFAEPSNS